MATKNFFSKEHQDLSEVEQKFNTALAEINKDIFPADVSLVSVKAVAVAGGKQAYVVFVPFRQLKKIQKVQDRLTQELEKKLAGVVVFIAQRVILSDRLCRIKGVERPYSRTVTAVHKAILEDVVYPVNIVGQRTRVRLDQSKLLKVYLSPKDAVKFEDKLKAFNAIYTKLTNKEVEFSFPAQY